MHDRTKAFHLVAYAILVGILLPTTTGAGLAQPEQPFQQSVAVLNGPVLPGMPVRVQLTWRNRSEGDVTFQYRPMVSIAITRAGEKPIVVSLYEDPFMGYIVYPKVTLRPGEAFSGGGWWVLAADDRPPQYAKFLFPEPGTYRLRPAEFEAKANAELVVKEPTAPADRASRGFWTVDVAHLFLGRVQAADRALPAIDKILAEFPESAYAPYAAWAKANYLRTQHTSGDFNFQLEIDILEFITKRHPGSIFQEEALYQIVCDLCSMTSYERARQVAQSLARQYPESKFLVQLRNRYGQDFERMKPPQPPTPVLPKSTKPCALQIQELARIPDGPRQVFETYWQTVAREDAEAIQPILAEDFMGDLGSRAENQKNLRYSFGRYNFSAMEVTLRECQEVGSYRRPGTPLGGQVRSWQGRICVVHGSLVRRYEDRWSGQRVEGKNDNYEWALRQGEDGQWRIISEYGGHRNWPQVGLAKKICQALENTFVFWRVSDGERERHPFQEIKDRLSVADRVVDTRTEWKSTGLTMMGPKREQVQITGNLRLLVRDEKTIPPREEWMERKVTLLLDLTPDEKSLLLKDIQVSE